MLPTTWNWCLLFKIMQIYPNKESVPEMWKNTTEGSIHPIIVQFLHIASSCILIKQKMKLLFTATVSKLFNYSWQTSLVLLEHHFARNRINRHQLVPACALSFSAASAFFLIPPDVSSRVQHRWLRWPH